MTFESAAMARLRRYRGEADVSLENIRASEEYARRFSGRLFEGLEYVSALGREAGFEIESRREGRSFALRVAAGGGESAEVAFARIPGAAGESDEDLMHEELSHYSLDPSGYSGRVLGWTEAAGEGPCQIFSVYRDGIWRTKGLFVAKARGKVDDSDEILNGFCLRILGRVVDLASLTGGAGRKWADDEYTLRDLEGCRPFPTKHRFPK